MFKLLLLIVSAAGPMVVEGPSAKMYDTREACEAQIANEVQVAQALIDGNDDIPKGMLTVRMGKCFSEDELNKLRGGQSATEKSLHVNLTEK